MREGDLLVLNNARVIAARRFSDDGAIEFLFLEKLAPRRWRTLVKPGRKMRLNATVRIGGVEARVVEISEDGSRVIEFASDISPEEGGIVPLPPYMRRPAEEADRERYQTVFADVPGAVAAPTAGLHFTEEMLEGTAARFHHATRRAGNFSAGEKREHHRASNAFGAIFDFRRSGGEDQCGAAHRRGRNHQCARARISAARRRTTR